MPHADHSLRSEAGGAEGEVLSRLPFNSDKKQNGEAEDGVTCSVCHQISARRSSARKRAINGGFVVDPPQPGNDRPEYGPFVITDGRTRIMQSSTGGFRPTHGDHIRDSALCGSCHTLATDGAGSRRPEGRHVPRADALRRVAAQRLPQEHSCQKCHMPEVPGKAPITAVLGELRTGVRLHTFVGGNFFMLKMLNRYRDDLSVAALPQELTAAAEVTRAFLQTEAAHVTVEQCQCHARSCRRPTSRLRTLPDTSCPRPILRAAPGCTSGARSQWPHRVRIGRAESATAPSRATTTMPTRSAIEPHYREITSAEQVQIYESIMEDQHGNVTTGLLSAVGYLKDNRLLPTASTSRPLSTTSPSSVMRRTILISPARATAYATTFPSAMRRDPSRSKPSSGTSPSAFAGRTISAATRRRSRNASSATTSRCRRTPALCWRTPKPRDSRNLAGGLPVRAKSSPKLPGFISSRRRPSSAATRVFASLTSADTSASFARGSSQSIFGLPGSGSRGPCTPARSAPPRRAPPGPPCGWRRPAG